MGLYAIKQVVDAGAQYAGLAPDGVPTEVQGFRTFPWGTQAGLWEFPNEDIPYEIMTILIEFGKQSAWTLYIVDGAKEIQWLDGTSDNALVWADVACTIPPGAKLKLVTTGASESMEATIFFSPSDLGNT